MEKNPFIVRCFFGNTVEFLNGTTTAFTCSKIAVEARSVGS